MTTSVDPEQLEAVRNCCVSEKKYGYGTIETLELKSAKLRSEECAAAQSRLLTFEARMRCLFDDGNGGYASVSCLDGEGRIDAEEALMVEHRRFGTGATLET